MKQTKEIYNEVMAYCREHGLIKRLEKSFHVPESQRFNALDVGKSGLDVLDAVHCIYDASRTNFFMEELVKNVSVGDRVLEAGIGTGILSFCAAALGAKVYGCEINPAVFELAEKIKEHLETRRLIPPASVTFFLHDAMTFTPPEKVDVLISENIYTGMFFEYQVQITNHLLSHLRPGGISIPKTMRSFVSLTETHFPRTPKDKELFIPSEESGKEMTYALLSDPHQYDDINFSAVSPVSVDRTLVIEAKSSGSLNGLLIYSEVLLPSGKVIGKDDTTFLNNEIVVALSPSISVTKGDKVKLALAYAYSGKPEDAKIRITKLN
ncbi:MAG: methyltransferase domain-containing protein [Candidatus Taylorbacteria bacterium]|nr:methyltransferase domain-containing protein [Candidatus Taylorbacteria bacterium]